MLGCVLGARLTFQETVQLFSATVESLLILTHKGSGYPEGLEQVSKSASPKVHPTGLVKGVKQLHLGEN